MAVSDQISMSVKSMGLCSIITMLLACLTVCLIARRLTARNWRSVRLGLLEVSSYCLLRDERLLRYLT